MINVFGNEAIHYVFLSRLDLFVFVPDGINSVGDYSLPWVGVMCVCRLFVPTFFQVSQ